MKPEETYTVEQFISSAPTNQISYSKLCIYQKINTVYMATHNVLNDYRKEIRDATVTIKLSDEEYRKYRFRPKLLAYDIYGDTELYFMILFANNICNVKEFDSKKIKMIKYDTLQTILSSIYNSESNIINKNQ